MNDSEKKNKSWKPSKPSPTPGTPIYKHSTYIPRAADAGRFAKPSKSDSAPPKRNK